MFRVYKINAPQAHLLDIDKQQLHRIFDGVDLVERWVDLDIFESEIVVKKRRHLAIDDDVRFMIFEEGRDLLELIDFEAGRFRKDFFYLSCFDVDEEIGEFFTETGRDL